MTDTAVATQETKPATRQEYEAALLEQVVVMGDLAKLTPEQRVIYYREVCKSLDLNPLTRPFDYLVLNGVLRLYPNKTASDQLRSNHGISIDSVEHAEVGDLYIATVHGHDRTGRTDTDSGAVNVANLKGEARANAIMKAITKGKRRLTLSLAGLGWLDDSEVGSAGGTPVEVDPETGEIQDPEPRSLADSIAAKRAAVTSGREEHGPAPEGPGAEPVTEGDEPPHPADHAAARTATPVTPANAEAGIPTAAPPQAPAGSSPRTRDGGHTGNHLASEGSWKEAVA